MKGLGKDYTHQEVVNESHRLVHLLFFHRKLLQFLRRWPFTFALDVTYKTNRHGLYLYQIVGQTAIHTTFIIGQAFLSSEETESFEFVLTWLKECYRTLNLPNPVCWVSDAAKAILAAGSNMWP
jgi:hypothetical protein